MYGFGIIEITGYLANTKGVLFWSGLIISILLLVWIIVERDSPIISILISALILFLIILISSFFIEDETQYYIRETKDSNYEELLESYKIISRTEEKIIVEKNQKKTFIM